MDKTCDNCRRQYSEICDDCDGIHYWTDCDDGYIDPALLEGGKK